MRARHSFALVALLVAAVPITRSYKLVRNMQDWIATNTTAKEIVVGLKERSTSRLKIKGRAPTFAPVVRFTPRQVEPVIFEGNTSNTRPMTQSDRAHRSSTTRPNRRARSSTVSQPAGARR